MEKAKNREIQQPVTPVSRKMSPEDFRKWLRTVPSHLDPQHLMKQVQEAVILGISTTGTLNEEQSELLSSGMMMLGHERQYLVAESVVDERWKPMVMDLAQSIQKEYACVSSSEIALAGLAASAYYRSLRAARKMNAYLVQTETNMIGVHLMATHSKEIDRAERQYLSAIDTLRSRRQPQVNVKIQTKAAFFNESQTINCAPQSYAETNDPQ